MKTRILVLLLAISFGMFVSCNENEVPQIQSKKISKKLLKVKESTSRLRKVIGKNTSADGAAIKSLFSKGKLAKNITLKSSKSNTCATITEETGANNSIIVTVDYGTGCIEDGVLISGKIITTFSEENGTVIFDNVKEKFVDFSLTYDYCEKEDANGECISTAMIKETVTINGTVEYQSSKAGTTTPESTFYFNENLTLKFSNGEEITSKSNYTHVVTDKSFTITEGKGLYTGKNFEYTFQIVKPIVYNFECEETVFMPVSGIEKENYKGLDANGNTETFDYEINYGNGECDNKAIITENGTSEEVDFGV